MDDALYVQLLAALFPLLLVLVGLVAGSWLEARHFEDIRRREAAFRGMLTITFETLPPGWRVEACGLATGSAVVSMDYFKRLLAGLRSLVGGRLRAVEPLLERGRREAVLRMQEQAAANGFEAIINVRLETAQLDTTGRASIAAIEMLAYGTAVRFDRGPASGNT